MTPSPTKRSLDRAREIADILVGRANLGRYERDIFQFEIDQALDKAREETLDKAIKVTCKYCDCGRPLIGNTHTWQVLTSKNKKGEYKYNPVQEECLANAIKELKNQAIRQDKPIEGGKE